MIRVITQETIDDLLKDKFKLVYYERLGKKVYILKKWLNPNIFERHSRLFGHLDIGWTVKYPKQLIRVLLEEKVWEVT